MQSITKILVVTFNYLLHMATHLRQQTRTDIFATLKAFKPLEQEFIPFEISRTETTTFSARYRDLKNKGLLDGTYSFYGSVEPKGTLIFRKK